MTKPIRFGLVASGTEVHDLVATAQKAEHIGFSSIALNDHFNSTAAPMLGLQAMAAATSQIRIATSVLNQDLRHPTVLAKEAATLDLLSEGRLELGLGAGWVKADYDETGIAFDSAATRIDRLEEHITILRGLFGPDPLTFRGSHYAVTDLDASISYHLVLSQSLLSPLSPSFLFSPHTHYSSQFSTHPFFFSNLLHILLLYLHPPSPHSSYSFIRIPISTLSTSPHPYFPFFLSFLHSPLIITSSTSPPSYTPPYIYPLSTLSYHFTLLILPTNSSLSSKISTSTSPPIYISTSYSTTPPLT